MSVFLRQRLEALQVALTQPVRVYYVRALKVNASVNASGGHSIRGMRAAAGVKRQHRAVGAYAARIFRNHVIDERVPFYVVRLIRIAPRALDGHDNLGVAFKHVVDGIAKGLGIDDRDPRVRYVADQQRSPVAKQHWVRIELLAAPATAELTAVEQEQLALEALHALNSPREVVAAFQFDPKKLAAKAKTSVPRLVKALKKHGQPTPNVVRPKR